MTQPKKAKSKKQIKASKWATIGYLMNSAILKKIVLANGGKVVSHNDTALLKAWLQALGG